MSTQAVCSFHDSRMMEISIVYAILVSVASETQTLSSMNDGVLPQKAPSLFGAMPEFYLETSLDFIVFLLK